MAAMVTIQIPSALQVDDPLLMRVQQNLLNSVKSIIQQMRLDEAAFAAQTFLVGAVQVPTTALITGTNTVTHSLGRIPVGYVICDRSTAATVFRTAWTTTTISLTASASINVSLIVF